MIEKVPPHNDQAEEAVIGSCLIGGLAVVNEAREIIFPYDFYDEKRRLIWDAIVKMSNDRTPIDFITVKEKLKNELEKIGGDAYILHLASVVPTAAHIKHYAEIVRKKSLARQKIRQCFETAEKLYDDEDPVEVISQGMIQDSKLIADKTKSEIIHVRQKVFEVYGSLEDRKETNGIIGIPTGYSDLDRKIGGLRKGNLHILAARPSMGKTTLALNVAKYTALKERIPTIFVSLEMTNDQLVEKLITEDAGLDSQLLQNTTKLTDQDWRHITRSCGRIAESSLYLDDSHRIRASDLAVRLRRFTALHQIGLVIVDYIQIMAPERHADRNKEVSETSGILQGLAKELNIPILALSQLSRDVENRNNKIPKLADLRDSGTLEQDASTVMFLYREDYYNPPKEPVDPSLVNLIIAKNRFGPLGRVDFQFFKSKSRFALAARRNES
ncbi:MAG: replicative DNA helicase [Deltaproteobacteria bacterium]|nr:replicative DNA helicase [Deltaproteobacteria bacterium]